MRVHAVSFIVALMLAAQCSLSVAAPVIDPRYGAVVLLSNLTDYRDEGQTSAGGSLVTGPGGAVISEGGALFGGSPSLHVNVTSIAGRGVTAQAYVFDELTFHVAGGGAADVAFTMIGNWTGQGFSNLYYSLYLGSGGVSDRASPTGFLASRDISHHAASQFVIGSGDYLSGAAGTYEIDGFLHVVDGGVYSVLASVKADASDGARAYIDDPLTTILPAGVTFTSASGSTYMNDVPVAAVPEPSTWLLMASGLIGIGWVRRVQRPAA